MRWLGLAIPVFLLLATLNSGGYRYGASDQAFYIPAILRALQPDLFPRDAALIGPQARYFFVDEIVAGGIRTIGGSIETWFLAGYVLALALLAIALMLFGRTVFSSAWTVTALVAVYTLKHRISKTGVNTLEGYFHPRVLVFAAGVAAIALYLRGRPWPALALVAAAGLLHPTTAAFFVLLIGVATWVEHPAARRALTAASVVGLGTFIWLVTLGPWRDALVPMDAAWRQLLASKDYLFPPEVWPATAWLANLGTAAVAIGGLYARQLSGVARPGERGLLAGAIVLLALFLVTLPAVEMGLALAVQLQLARVFWLLELIALIPALWWLVDRPLTKGGAWRWTGIGVTLALLSIAVARGGYVSLVERAPAFARVALPASDWTNAMRWIQANTPTNAHILADPEHAIRYGYPVRFAGRDVYLEDIKDTAMALYNRAAADRVLTRARDIGNFATLTADQARALAAKYDLDYLVIARPLSLPERATFGELHIYALR